MKTFALISTLLTTLFAALLLVPALEDFTRHLAVFILGFTIISIGILAIPEGNRGRKEIATEAPSPASIPAVVPPPAGGPATAEAEIVAFLGLLQEKGRLVDFLMDDITPYEDAQVGAAARVVHQGCRAALQEHFTLAPVCASEEGSTVTVPAGDESADYRLVGKIAGQPPFTGTLVHKGWKTTGVKLPRLVATKRPPALAPAEVELR